MPSDPGSRVDQPRNPLPLGADRPKSTEPRPGSTPFRRIVLGLYATATLALLVSPIPVLSKLVPWSFLTVLLGAIWLAGWIQAWARALRGEDERMWLYEYGRPAEGLVLELLSRHESMNDDPVVRVRVQLTPTEGEAPVVGTRDVFVSMLAVPWIGERLPVLYDPADPNRFTIITEVDDGSPARARELHRVVRSDRRPLGLVPSPRPDPDLLPVVARLGRITQERRSGELSRRKAERQSKSLLSEHFHIGTTGSG
jgi:hypothetical protein